MKDKETLSDKISRPVLMCGPKGAGTPTQIENIDVKHVRGFISDLNNYNNLKINLNSKNRDISKETKEMVFACLLDNKMFINKLAGDELVK